ncbi:MAG: YggS family pyridoxal phosphate-dependent enzyme [Bacteroidales bacterium]|nr:YggS family pyridoxal phosphate-dependent enzyme [Bacteroidales bacterium]
MSSISDAINEIRSKLPSSVCLVAVSKTHPIQFIEEAYACGQRHFGENKVQEMVEKAEQLPADIKWHMIGHLQTNKVKYIAPFVHMIHSIDSEKLLATVDKEAKKCNRVIPCLLQVHVAKEETKFGFLPEELEEFLASDCLKNLKNVKICGLMGMASFTDDTKQIADEFEQIKNLFENAKNKYFTSDADFREISMGMSNDYPIAIEHGTTIIRVGTGIFGKRYYQV